MKDFNQILFSGVIASVGGLLAGIFLGIYADRLELIPGILVLLPGFLDMRGGIGASFSARIGSALHIGSLKPKIKKQPILNSNLLAAVSLTLIVSAFLGIVSFAVTYFIFGKFFIEIIFIPILAGIISTLMLLPITTLLSFNVFRRGLDPDDIVGPTTTTIGDVISVVALLVAIIVIV